MAMKVDETRCDQLTSDIHRVRGFGYVDTFGYFGHKPVFESNIPAAINALGRVKNVSAGEY